MHHLLPHAPATCRHTNVWTTLAAERAMPCLAVSAILDGDTDKDKKLKPEKTAKEGLVDTSSHPLTPNFFGGQYSPFVPIAALGAAITIGDRSQLTLGAMTLAGIVTAIQLNNPDCADRSLGGLKKSREEIAFDQAKDYLLAAVRREQTTFRSLPAAARNRAGIPHLTNGLVSFSRTVCLFFSGLARRTAGQHRQAGRPERR